MTLPPSQFFGIIVGAQSGIVRGVLIPDTDAQLDAREAVLGPGVVMIRADRATYAGMDPKDIVAAIGPVFPQARGQGGPKYPARCAVVDAAGNVVNVIAADPLIDTHPDGELIQDDDAGPGWKRDKVAKTFKPPKTPAQLAVEAAGLAGEVLAP